MEFVGKTVEIIDKTAFTFGKIGVIDWEGIWGETRTFKVSFVSEGKDDWTYVNLDQFKVVAGKGKDGCECGCSAVGSAFHSHYCRLYRPD